MAQRHPSTPLRTQPTATPEPAAPPTTAPAAAAAHSERDAPPPNASAATDGAGIDRRPLWLGALLFLLTLAIYLPALRYDFITYDDPGYVIHEPHVNTGLSWENFRWAWTSFEHANWHPLTWLSHQLDCQLFGLAPWGHHLTSALLHALNTLLLFAFLRHATGFLWRSLAVAALFGLHPLHVESVAWVAERKDVLSTLLGLLTLWAYTAYSSRMKAGLPRAWRPYLLALLAFAAGLSAKPMLVTLPCAMLLLDLWPLGRWSGATTRRRLALVVEKLPFFALAAASCVLTSLAQSAGGAMKAVECFPLSVRIANALVAYGLYLAKLFWPADLAVLYPSFGEMPPAENIVLAFAVLAVLSGAALFALRRGRAWAAVSWLWFLGTLVPVIGLVQVGGQTMADRYSYIPSIGMFLVVVWGTAELTRSLSRRTLALGTAAALALAACSAQTLHQLAYWRNTETLFRHAVAVTDDNWMAHFNLFQFYRNSPADQSKARESYERAIAIIGTFAERQNQRGLALLRQGRNEEAIVYFRRSIRVKKDHTPAHINLGLTLLQSPSGLDEAVAAFRTALQLDPQSGDAQLGLGRALARMPDHLSEAISELRMAVWLLPDRADAHLAFADALALDPNRRATAIAEYEKALDLDPSSAAVRKGLERLR